MPRLQRCLSAGALLGRHQPFVLAISGIVRGDHCICSDRVVRRGVFQGTREPDQGLCYFREPPSLDLCHTCREQASLVTQTGSRACVMTRTLASAPCKHFTLLTTSSRLCIAEQPFVCPSQCTLYKKTLHQSAICLLWYKETVLTCSPAR